MMEQVTFNIRIEASDDAPKSVGMRAFLALCDEDKRNGITAFSKEPLYRYGK